MAFPTGWTRSCKLTIQHGQVPADQTAFPVLITAACLPEEMVTSGGINAAQSDGGDIRFSTDSAGVTQLACEIVSFTQNATPSSATAEIWVPVHVLTGSDVDIYVWYKAGGGLSQPAASASFGSQAVWDSNYKAVYHLQSLTAESTSNANTATNSGVTTTAAEIGSGGTLNGSSYLDLPDVASLQLNGVMTLSTWINVTTFPSVNGAQAKIIFKGYNTGAHTVGYALLFDVNGSAVELWVGSFAFGWANAAWAISGWSTGSWHHIAGFWDGVNLELFFDGALVKTQGSAAGARLVTSHVYVGGSRDNDSGSISDTFTGKLDEIRISAIARSANWITTEYNNQHSPTTFVVAGMPSGGGGGTAIAALMNSYRQRRV